MRNFESYVKRNMLGPKVLSGVWQGETPHHDEYRLDEFVNTMLFLLDGSVYESAEDPEDGYRSHLDHLIERPELFPTRWWNTSERVHGYFCDAYYNTAEFDKDKHTGWRWWRGDPYPGTDEQYAETYWNSHEAELLVFESVVTNLPVLILGTGTGDVYYPFCIQAFYPEYMSINSEDRSHVDIVGWDEGEEDD